MKSAPGSGRAVRWRMPPICAAVSCGFSAEHQPDDAGDVAGSPCSCRVIAIQRSPAAKPFAATMSVPGAAMSGFSRPSRVGPWLLVMLIRRARLVEVRDGDDPRAAGERADRRVVDDRALGEERRERPRLALADPADAARVVALDPARGSGRRAPRRPISRTSHCPARDADDCGLAQQRAQVDGDVVRAVGRVVELVVDAEEAAVRELAVLDELARLDRPPSTRRPGGLTCTAKRSCAPYQISSSFSERSTMPLPTTFHSMSATSSRAAIAPARVDAAHDLADVVLVLGALLAGVAGGDADAAAGPRERRVDPAGDRGSSRRARGRWCPG